MSSIGTSRRGGRGRSNLHMNAEINVTSLVDVAFTLLVIFIITAPILQGGIEVGIPRADVQALNASEAPFYISILRDGQIMMEETPVSLEELEEGLPQLLAAGTIDRVYIRADSLAPYGPVLRTMAVAQRAGVSPALVAEPYRGGR
jgi:biopolymer transport protein ExbD